MFATKSRVPYIVSAFGGALLLALTLCRTANAQTPQMTPEERAAVQLVQDWFAAWNTNDPEKVASYLAPDVAFHASANSLVCHGPGPIMTRYKFIMRLGAKISDVHAFAVADRVGDKPQQGWGVAVLSSRVDTFKTSKNFNGPLTASGFFIIMNGKIKEFWEEPAQQGTRRGPPPTCEHGL